MRIIPLFDGDPADLRAVLMTRPFDVAWAGSPPTLLVGAEVFDVPERQVAFDAPEVR